jgi:hypothetical protein
MKITDVRQQNRKALYMILHLDSLKKEYAFAMNNMSFLGAQNLDGMPHGTGVGNPTQQKAMRLTDMETNKSWIMAIEQMEETLNEKQKAFLVIRRKAEKEAVSTGGRPAWMPYARTRYNEWYYERYGTDGCVSEKTLRIWQSKIVDRTVRLAIYYGCFSM